MQTLWLFLLTIPILTIDILFVIIFIRHYHTQKALQRDPNNTSLAQKTIQLRRFRNVLMIALILVTLSILMLVLRYPSPSSIIMPTKQELTHMEEWE